MKANEEAAVVLKGLLNPKLALKGSGVAKELHRQFAESGLAEYESTFEFMVEACINAGDLRGASSFLMKMETAGYCADSSLLDRVMDLYSEAKIHEAASIAGAVQKEKR